MEELDIVKKAGLTDSQARFYLELIQSKPLTPAQLAKHTDESRTNAYNILSKLESFNLVTKNTTSKTISYSATHPINLEVLAEKRLKTLARAEQDVKANLDKLTNTFYEHNELPGSRTLTGIDGIKSVYEEILQTKQDVYFIRSTADFGFTLGQDWWRNYRNRQAKAGVHIYALTHNRQSAREHIASGRDKELNFHRTLMPADAYQSPVGIYAFGDRAAFIAFGNTQIATIINSQPIADAIRKILLVMTEYYKENYPQKISRDKSLTEQDTV